MLHEFMGSIVGDLSELSKGVTSSLGHYAAPLVTRERFAEMCGLPVGVIIGWCNKGLVPCLSVGKYSLINIELLRKRCLDQEFA
jgi:hypothetical protein